MVRFMGPAESSSGFSENSCLHEHTLRRWDSSPFRSLIDLQNPRVIVVFRTSRTEYRLEL